MMKEKKGVWFWSILALIPILVVVAGLRFLADRLILDNPVNGKALAVCTELEQAIQHFYDDNGTLPVELDGDSVFSSNSQMGLEMLRVLMNQESRDHPLNGKGVKYLNVKQGKRNKDGLIWNEAGTQITGLYDPWGGPYMIALDGDFNESITVQPKAQKEPRTLQRRVVVWSNGKNPDKAKDDVTTW